MNLHVLVSFAYYPDLDMGAVRTAMGPDALLIVDSGAYTAHTTGKTIRIGEYAAFLDRWHDVIDAAITLDVIGDPAATAANTTTLHGMGHQVLPVHTTGGDLADFDTMCKTYGWVAIGGIAGIRNQALRTRYITMLSRRAAEHAAVVHLLGVGSLAALRCGAYSADASGYITAITRGYRLTLFDGLRLRQIAIGNPVDLRRHQTLLTGLGLDVARMLARGKGTLSRAHGIIERLQEVSLWSLMCARTLMHPPPHLVAAPRPGLPDGPLLVVAASAADDDIPILCRVAAKAAAGDVPPPFARMLARRTA